LYYGLPDVIKNLVVPRGQIDTGKGNTQVARQPLMSFRVASQLGRLVEKGVPEHDVLFLARRFWDEGLSSEEKAKKRVDEYLKAYDFRHLDMHGLFDMNAAEVARVRSNYEAASRYLRPMKDALRFFTQAAYAIKYDLPTNQDGIALTVVAREMVDMAKTMRLILPEAKRNLSAAKRSEIIQTLTEWEKMAKQFGGLLQSLDIASMEETEEGRMIERQEITI